MKKLLKIKFVKFERALAMQILEQTGLPERKSDGFVRILSLPALHNDGLDLRGVIHADDWKLSYTMFKNNKERDDYLDKVNDSICNELFNINNNEINIGDIVEASDDSKFTEISKSELLAILPKDIEIRYIMRVCDHYSCPYRYVRPIKKQPITTIEKDGCVITITWEIL